MLVVSRCKDESVMIGDDLMLTVVLVRANRAHVIVRRKVRGGRITSVEQIAELWIGRGDSITLAEDVSCTAVDFRGEAVRLCFIAPKGLPVHRREVYDAIRRESREAGHDDGDFGFPDF